MAGRRSTALALLTLVGLGLVLCRGAEAQTSATDRARSLNVQGQTLMAQGQWARAERIYLQALDLCPQAEPYVQACLAAVNSGLGAVHHHLNDFSGAEIYLERSVQAARKAFPPDHPELVQRLRQLADNKVSLHRLADAETIDRELARIAAANLELPVQLRITCFMEFATVLQDLGKFSDADPIIGQAIGVVESEKTADTPTLAVLYHLRGQSRFKARDYSGADQYFAKAIQLRRSIAPSNDLTAALFAVDLADSYIQQNNYAAAHKAVDDALKLIFADNKVDDNDLANALAVSGLLSTLDGRFSDADSSLTRALSIQERLFGAASPNLTAVLIDLATARSAERRDSDAVSLLARAISIAAATDTQSATAHNALARTYMDEGAYDKAAAEFGAAARIAEQIPGATSESTTALAGQASAEMAAGQNSQALAHFEAAIPKLKAFGDSTRLAEADADMAIIQSRQGQAARGNALLADAVKIAAAGAADDPALSEAFFVKAGEEYDGEGRYKQAGDLLDHALAIAEKADGRTSSLFVVPLSQRAKVFLEVQDFPKAEAAYNEVLQIDQQLFGTKSIQYAEALENLASLEDGEGHYAKALDGYQRAAGLAEPLGDGSYLASLKATLAYAYFRMADYPKATAAITEAITWERANIGPSSGRMPGYLNTLAYILYAEGRYAEAERTAHEALAALDGRLAPTSPTLANWNGLLGQIYMLEGRYREADAALGSALSTLERDGSPPDHALAIALDHMGSLALAEGKPKQAAEDSGRALALEEAASGPDSPDVATRLDGVTRAAMDQARYADARASALRAMQIREKSLPAGHPAIGSSDETLGDLAVIDGRYADAEKLYHQALAIQRSIHGPDHPNLAPILESLASLGLTGGRQDEARQEADQALAINRKVFGDANPATARSLAITGDVLFSLGRFSAAKAEYQQALDVQTQVFGEGHPQTAATIGDLGAVALVERRYEDARSLYSRALGIEQAVYGPDHPNLTYALDGLVSVDLADGRLGEARREAERSLAIERRTFGEGQLPTASGLTASADVLAASGQYVEANAGYQKVLNIEERLLGEDHPWTASTLMSIGSLAFIQGRYSDARGSYSKALDIRTKLYGEDGLVVAQTNLAIAELDEAQGQVAAALAIQSRSLSQIEAVVGSDHVALVQALLPLSFSEFYLGDLAKAAASADRAALLLERAGLKDSLDYVPVLVVRAAVASRQKHYADAEAELGRALAVVRSKLGEGDIAMAAPLNNLGQLYLVQGKHKEAETALLKAIAIQEHWTSPDHPKLIAPLSGLATLYRAEGRAAEAGEIQKRIAGILQATHLQEAPVTWQLT